ncbi:hypothetical protein QC761_0031240 [Podospora bellae-mahoneyi]|uniref:Uncharacterized protein n=1 Tax=Podospora bellae-mahoneyi TaxID=2093777 RepID=A0ABR0FQZ7_9PEZI|nr:hypothetical protein QC761_0031240 [Podospora bellae-mahoneyi]
MPTEGTSGKQITRDQPTKRNAAPALRPRVSSSQPLSLRDVQDTRETWSTQKLPTVSDQQIGARGR